MSHEVFLSHASEDKPFANALCAGLEAAGVRCWIAPRDVLPGQNYAEALVDALDRCRVFVLVLSARSNDSPHVQREAERAASRSVPIVPVRIQDVPLSKAMQYFVGSSHWTDALDPPLEKHVPRIVDAVRRHLAARPAAPNSAVPAAPPPAYAPSQPAPGPAYVQPQQSAPAHMPSPPVEGGPKLAQRPRRGLPIALTLVLLAILGAALPLRRTARRLANPGSDSPQAAASPAPAVSDAACLLSQRYQEAMEKGQDLLERKLHILAEKQFKSARAACPGDAGAEAGWKQAKRGMFRENVDDGDFAMETGDSFKAGMRYEMALAAWPDSPDAPEAAAVKAKLRQAKLAREKELDEEIAPKKERRPNPRPRPRARARETAR